MVLRISVAGANQLSLDLFAIIAILDQVLLDLSAIITILDQVLLDLSAIIAFCIPKYKDFACLDWPGPTLNFQAICDVLFLLSRDLTAIIAVRF